MFEILQQLGDEVLHGLCSLQADQHTPKEGETGEKSLFHSKSPVAAPTNRITLMESTDFVGYVGLPDFHDGVVLRVSVQGKTAEVVVEGYSGREHVVVFEGVHAVKMNQPEGMLLYSLSEMRAAPPLREFVFTNNEEDHPGYLSILATDFSVRSD